MVVPGLNIGIGLFTLLVLWVLTVLLIVGLAAVPKARYAIPVVVLFCLAVTVVFVIYPRGHEKGASVMISNDLDTAFYRRLGVLVFLFAFSIAGCAVTVLHFFEPTDARPL